VREIINAIALGIGYLSLAGTAVALLAAIVMNYRPVEKKRREESGPREETPAKIREPFVGRWLPEASPHPLKHPAVHVDAKSDDEAWRAIGGKAS
jgi:hypothetical protein